MHILNVRDVNEALPRALAYLRDCGTLETTRNGPALVAPGPVATVYREPRRRVLFDPDRDANPFFHLFESLWILAGRRDVRFLSWFNSRIAEYSDDGATFHAPYGYRLREQLGVDQVSVACTMLRDAPQSRRVVLQIWHPLLDLGAASKDLPCNDTVMLRVREDPHLSIHSSGKELDITVCNRSNDAIWGAYGANAVQFSMLQEYMAWHIGVGVGKYVQMSNNLHVYTDNPYWQQWKATPAGRGIFVRESEYDQVDGGSGDFFADISPLEDSSLGKSFVGARCFDMDMRAFFDLVDAGDLQSVASALPGTEFMTSFFKQVVRPMLLAFAYRKTDPRYALALCASSGDWCYAGSQWLERRGVFDAKE